MASGPTQNYHDATLGTWRPRPVLAMTVRVLIVAIPIVLALGVGLMAVRWFPPQDLGLHPWLWLLLQMLVSMTVVLLVSRWTRRLVPLTTLLRMTLVFADHAPSRFAVARRTFSPALLERRVAEPRPSGGGDEADLVLELVSALGAHDRVTFRHSERVQAYAGLIATEMGLSREDATKLSWAALLHDVGKLRVPTKVLASSRRPSEAEWQVLTTHPDAGMDLASPLATWLGPWHSAIGQHHERWDGAGYPAGLRGAEIGLGARIVAVADAFDVITSARPYKEPLSPAAAREELARCAGTQFDPDVVHAFLRVGLGRVRVAAGPLSLLTAVPGLRVLPAPDLSSAASVLGSAVPAAGTAVTSAALGATLAATGALGHVAVPVRQESAAVIESDAGTSEDVTRDGGRGDAPGGTSARGTGGAPGAQKEPPASDRTGKGPVQTPEHAGGPGAPATPGAPAERPHHAGTPGPPAERPDHAGTPGPPVAPGEAPAQPETRTVPSTPREPTAPVPSPTSTPDHAPDGEPTPSAPAPDRTPERGSPRDTTAVTGAG